MAPVELQPKFCKRCSHVKEPDEFARNKRSKDGLAFYCKACCHLRYILPLKLKGPNIIENIQPLCSSCNSRKGSHYVDYRYSHTMPEKELADALLKAREDLKDARYALSVEKARAEQRAIDAAGGLKQLGSSADERERRLIIALDDDPAYRLVLGKSRIADLKVATLEVHVDRVLREQQAVQWQIRERLADALMEYASRPCMAGIEHATVNEVLDSTGEKGVYAGESDWVETKRVA